MEFMWRRSKGLDIVLPSAVMAVASTQTKCACITSLSVVALSLRIIHLISDISYRTRHSFCFFPTCFFTNSGRSPPEMGIRAFRNRFNGIN